MRANSGEACVHRRKQQNSRSLEGSGRKRKNARKRFSGMTPARLRATKHSGGYLLVQNKCLLISEAICVPQQSINNHCDYYPTDKSQ